MQEDKEGLFDALSIPLDCLHMAALVLDGIQVKTPMLSGRGATGYANATELARITRSRKACRSAKRTYCRRSGGRSHSPCGKPLSVLPLAGLQKFSRVIGDDVYPYCLCSRVWINGGKRRRFSAAGGAGHRTMPGAPRAVPYKRSAISTARPSISDAGLTQKAGPEVRKVHVGF